MNIDSPSNELGYQLIKISPVFLYNLPEVHKVETVLKPEVIQLCHAAELTITLSLSEEVLVCLDQHYHQPLSGPQIQSGE